MASIQNSKLQIPDSHLPGYFSFTQLKAFESCPLQYKFAHILKIPIEGRYTFSFGKSMHKALELFFTRMLHSAEQAQLFTSASSLGAAPSLEELLKMYDASWLNEWYDSTKDAEEYYARGKKILKEFFQIHSKAWSQPRYLEKPFTIKFGEYELRGVIDRVDTLTEGEHPEIEIIDYKTGRVPDGNTLPFDKKQQLLIYQLAVERLTEERPQLLSYYYLEQNKKVSFLGTAADLEKVESFVVETIEGIRGGNFSATPEKMVCSFCDFKNICEYRAV